MAIELRPEVRAFAEAMQRLLDEHQDEKGDAWKDDTAADSMAALDRQMRRLYRTIYAVPTQTARTVRIGTAAASVGAHAMFVADVMGALDTQETTDALAVQLRTERDAAVTLLRRLEWLDMGHAYPLCPVCEGHEHAGHAAGCELAALSATPAPDGRRDAVNGRSA